jgi:tRNA/rRNA methyltransferase
LAEAVAGATLVLGTGTLTRRKAEQRVVALPELAPLVGRELACGGRIALVFGPEKHGLTRDDLSFCHLLVEIPTDPKQPSMNLGQAVAVCLYELTRSAVAETPSGKWADADQNSGKNDDEEPSRAKARIDYVNFMRGLKPPPPSERLDLLAGVIEEAMQAAGYSPRAMQPANRHDLRLLLRRLSLSAHDTRRILGLFRRILWRLRQVQDSDGKSG